MLGVASMSRARRGETAGSGTMFSRLLFVVALTLPMSGCQTAAEHARRLPRMTTRPAATLERSRKRRHMPNAARTCRTGVTNGIAYRHAESDLEPARDDEEPDDDGALITLAGSRWIVRKRRGLSSKANQRQAVPFQSDG
jgi:hypothetical protein